MSKNPRDNSISGIEGSAQIKLKATFPKWGRRLEHESEELLLPGLRREWVGWKEQRITGCLVEPRGQGNHALGRHIVNRLMDS